MGTHMYQEAATPIQKVLTQTSTWMFEDRASAIMIIATVGKHIMKKCDTAYLVINQKLTNREPLDHPRELKKEIEQIEELQEDLSYQEMPVSSTMMYATLKKAIAKLVLKPEMIQVLTMPVIKCEAEHPRDGKKLMDVLQDAVFILQTDPMYKKMLDPKPTATAEVGGANGNP